MISSESSDDEWMTGPPPAKKHQTTSVEKKKTKVMTDEERKERDLRRQAKREEKKKRKAQERELAKNNLIKEEEDAKAKHGRLYTVSIALPGSIIDNAQSKELRTYLAGQIARAAVIFQVDEIIIFDDQLESIEKKNTKKGVDCNLFLNRVLQYLETPQYLRKTLFPYHPDLTCAGLLNPLDCPHHLRQDEWFEYREGVVVQRPTKKGKEESYVNIGLRTEAKIDTAIVPGVRVTVQIDPATKDHKQVKGKAVALSKPREYTGRYWGYRTRIATSLSKVWSECPFEGGYDLKVGTSERGHVSVDDEDFALPPFKHVLITFGGVAGLEECVNADEELEISQEDTHTLFDMWVNTCPHQGSRTIRSEEALLISMSALRKSIAANKVPSV